LCSLSFIKDYKTGEKAALTGLSNFLFLEKKNFLTSSSLSP
jgi:hypothetical protein